MAISPENAEKFMKSVHKTSTCWIWTKGKHPAGYGVACVGGEVMRAHRVSYIIHNGPIADGMHICHICDNPPCVNPDHLYAGTALDNARDKKERGRYNNGCETRSRKYLRGTYPQNGKWVCEHHFNGKRTYLGYANDEDEGHLIWCAYELFIKELLNINPTF